MAVHLRKCPPLGPVPPINGNCNNVGPNGVIIGSCNVSTPHDKDGLYQGDAKIGRIQGQIAIDEPRSMVAFAQVVFTTYPDPSKPFEYANFLLTCDKFPRLKPNELPAAIFADLEISVQCHVIGKR
jgi:hypothetical protein